MKLVLSSDWHLTGYVPTCRIESKQEWLDFQYQRICEVVDIANTHEADLVIAGDLFDRPREEDEVISMFLRGIKPLLGTCYLQAGNHPLPNHREANVMNSSLGILISTALYTEKIKYLPSNEETVDGRFEHSVELTPDIICVHTLCFEKEEQIPFGARATHASSLVEKYNYPFILVGDLHQAYDIKVGNSYVISSGCLTAQTVKEKDTKCGVYLIDTGNVVNVTVATDKKRVFRTHGVHIEFIPVFNDPALISTLHIKPKKQESSLSSLVEVLQNGDKISLDYERNLLNYLENNAIIQGVQEVIEEVRDAKVK